MKTLQEIKDQVAKKNGYSKWDMFIVECAYVKGPDQLEMMEEVVQLFAKEKCKEQREICALACDAANVAPSTILWDAITNAPEPKML